MAGGDTLAYLAQEYAVQTSWLKLWALNSDPIRSPRPPPRPFSNFPHSPQPAADAFLLPRESM